MTIESSFVVFRAHVAIEGFRLDDGTIIAAPVFDPPVTYCLAHRCGERLEIIGRFPTQAEAEEACDGLAEQLEHMAINMADSTVDLQRIVQAASKRKH